MRRTSWGPPRVVGHLPERATRWLQPCDVDCFLDVTDEVCEELTGYKFENVLRVWTTSAAGPLRQHWDRRDNVRFFEDGFTSSEGSAASA